MKSRTLATTFGSVALFTVTPALAGDPVPGIDVSLEQIPQGRVIAHVQTDGLGGYEFRDVGPGSYCIRTSPISATSIAPMPPSSANEYGPRLFLATFSADRDRARLIRIAKNYNSSRSNVSTSVTVGTQAQPTTTQALTDAPASASNCFVVTGQAAQTVRGTLTIEPAAMVGDPVPGIDVSLEQIPGGRAPDTPPPGDPAALAAKSATRGIVVGQGGDALVGDPVPGIDVSLEQIPGGRAPATPPPGDASEIHDPGITILELASAGDPIPGIDISLEEIPGGRAVANGQTAADGRATLVALPAGDYRLIVDSRTLMAAVERVPDIATEQSGPRISFGIGVSSGSSSSRRREAPTKGERPSSSPSRNRGAGSSLPFGGAALSVPLGDNSRPAADPDAAIVVIVTAGGKTIEARLPCCDKRALDRGAVVPFSVPADALGPVTVSVEYANARQPRSPDLTHHR